MKTNTTIKTNCYEKDTFYIVAFPIKYLGANKHRKLHPNQDL